MSVVLEVAAVAVARVEKGLGVVRLTAGVVVWGGDGLEHDGVDQAELGGRPGREGSVRRPMSRLKRRSHSKLSAAVWFQGSSL